MTEESVQQEIINLTNDRLDVLERIILKQFKNKKLPAELLEQLFFIKWELGKYDSRDGR